ncbi:unnamed protein product [Linum trigynum]|uniref:Uncharacterized protein n=1 Tax=Linum trigynum TaxID=586398 RepID=A0AAV2CGS0_9ROSI
MMIECIQARELVDAWNRYVEWFCPNLIDSMRLPEKEPTVPKSSSHVISAAADIEPPMEELTVGPKLSHTSSPVAATPQEELSVTLKLLLTSSLVAVAPQEELL